MIRTTLLSLLLVASASEVHAIEWQFKEGRKFEYTIGRQFDVNAGKDKKEEQKIELVLAFKVLESDAKSITLSVTPVKCKISFDPSEGEVATFDSEAEKNPGRFKNYSAFLAACRKEPLSIILSRQGSLRGIKIAHDLRAELERQPAPYSELSGFLSIPGIQELFQTLFIVFPSTKPTRKGWSYSVRAKHAIGDVQVEVRLRPSRNRRSRKAQEGFVIGRSFAFLAGGAIARLQKSSGHVLFGKKSGLLEELSLDHGFTLRTKSKDGSGEEVLVDTRYETSFTAKLRAPQPATKGNSSGK